MPPSDPNGSPSDGNRILVLNPGSSSLKASLIELPDTTLGRADVSWGADASRSAGRDSGVATALEGVGLDATPGSALSAVGYRVVHGGASLTEPVTIDDAVIEAIGSVAPLAPLHTGMALETIEAGRRLLPDVPHVACFDTAFHATLPPESYRYPVPEAWYRDWGVRRFGFHGLSVEWSVRAAARLLALEPEDLCLLVAHLGSGCSVTAVDGGRSVDTSMGLTPLEGPMMGTRSGSIDPGVPLHLLERGYLDVSGLADALDHGSGLLGVSGTTSHMGELVEAATGDERAALAVAMFVHRAAAWIAALATSLPRLDAIVFTGGIGEHAAGVRRAIVARLAVLGLPPLPEHDAGRLPAERLDDGEGPVAVLRVEAREDLVIASQAGALAGRR